jgi:hypothetical protein
MLSENEGKRLMNALMLIGPPADIAKDKKVATEVASFSGFKLACGGSTTRMLAREWAKPMQVHWSEALPGVPPSATVPGLDLSTEGFITLKEVREILADQKPFSNNPASKLAAMLLSSQYVEIHVGTAINPANREGMLSAKIRLAKKIASLLQQRGIKTKSVYW